MKFRRGARVDRMSVDDIIAMSDDELNGRLERTHHEIERVRSRGSWNVELESDFCYLVRERRIRDERAHAHSAYLDRLLKEDRDEFLREAMLPEYRPTPPPKSWRSGW